MRGMAFFSFSLFLSLLIKRRNVIFEIALVLFLLFFYGGGSSALLYRENDSKKVKHNALIRRLKSDSWLIVVCRREAHKKGRKRGFSPSVFRPS